MSIGVGHCVGGMGPDLLAFPLLCWCRDHPSFGHEVFTEDGALCERHVLQYDRRGKAWAEVAAHFGTTVEHVMQIYTYMGR